MPQSLIGTIVLCLALSLCSCANEPTVTVKHACPSGTLLQDRPLPKWDGENTGALLNWALDTAEVVDQGNADKSASRLICK